MKKVIYVIKMGARDIDPMGLAGLYMVKIQYGHVVLLEIEIYLITLRLLD